MTILLSIFALLAVASLASWAWGVGYNSGYVLGEKHGRQTAEADALQSTTHVKTFRMEPTGAEFHRALVAEMDRTRTATWGM